MAGNCSSSPTKNILSSPSGVPVRPDWQGRDQAVSDKRGGPSREAGDEDYKLARNTTDKQHLISLLQALRQKQKTEGTAGLSALFISEGAADTTTTSNTSAPHENALFMSDGTADTKMTPNASAPLDDVLYTTVSSAGNNNRLPALNTDYNPKCSTASSSRKRKGPHDECQLDLDASDCGSSVASSRCGGHSNNTASTYIAQLTCDMAARNALHSVSPAFSLTSSPSSSSSAASSASASLSTSPVHSGASLRQRTAPARGPPPAHREESMFAAAHSLLLQEMPPAPSTRSDAPSQKNRGRKGRRLPRLDSFVSEDSEDLNRSGDGRSGSASGGSCVPDKCSDNQPRSPSEEALASDGPEKRPMTTPALDTSEMSVEEILQYITVPKLLPHNPDEDILKDFLDQHEIDHLNHMIKCLTDAIIRISLPKSADEKSCIFPVEFLDIYLCCMVRVYFLLFKNLDFRNLLLVDQIILFESGALKALLCLSFLVFKEEGNCWHIPNNVREMQPVVLRLTDLNQILPHNLLQQALAINIISTKLKFDWNMGMLCIGAFFYCPVDVEVQQLNKIDKLRDCYMEILLKYLKWKHGSHNASVLFPEILKLMDAILKHCTKVENLVLRLKDEEVVTLKRLLRSSDAGGSNPLDSEESISFIEETLHSGVTFSKINRIISVQCNRSNSLLVRNEDLRHCAAVPTASMYYSNLPLESEEAKSPQQLETLIRRRILQTKQQQLQQQVSVDISKSSGEAEFAPALRSPRDAPQRNMNVLAIQRLLQDWARRDQPTESSRVPPVLSPTEEDEGEKHALQHMHPAALPLHALQQLYQANVLSALAQQQQQQHAHLTNFAKSLDYRSTTPKSPPPLSPLHGNLRVTATQVDDSNSAIDLSQRRRQDTPSPLSAIPSSRSSRPQVVPVHKASALPKLSPLYPSPQPPSGHTSDDCCASTSADGMTAFASCSSVTVTSAPELTRSPRVPALPTRLTHTETLPGQSSSRHSPQLTPRQIEMLLESLGQSKYSREESL